MIRLTPIRTGIILHRFEGYNYIKRKSGVNATPLFKKSNPILLSPTYFL